MSDSHKTLITRRRMLQQMAATAGATIAVPFASRAAAATAGKATPGKAAKSAVQYQDHPNGASACANCANFIPGANGTAMGQCTIVAGDISPQGWCVAYVNKS